MTLHSFDFTKYRLWTGNWTSTGWRRNRGIPMILMAKMLAKLLGKIGPTAHGPVVRLFDLQFGCCKITTSISPIRSASSHHRFTAIHSSPWSNCPTVPLSNCPTVQLVQPVFFRIAPVCSCEVIQFKCFFL